MVIQLPKLYRYVISSDIYERHYLMAHLASRFDPQNILDFGGEGVLSYFINSNVAVDTVNVNSKGNIPYHNMQIAVKDKAYDVVVSLDTFEHIDRKFRPVLVNELCRIARKGVVIAAPYGSPEHIQHEKHILKNLPSTTNPVFAKYLQEHIQHGLPTEHEMKSYFDPDTVSCYYAGRFDVQILPRSGWLRWSRLGKSIMDPEI